MINPLDVRPAGKRIDLLAVCFVIMYIGLRLWTNFALTDITTNDRGRDLYTAELTLRGKLPFRDYDWPYGPLAPFYYATWFGILGPSIRSYEAGEFVMIFLAALAVYLLARELVALPLAPVAPALWTCIYGVRAHSGYCILAVFFAALSLLAAARILHARENPTFNACLCIVSLGLLALTKLNAGLAWAAAIGAILAWNHSHADAPATDKRKRRRLTAVAVATVLAVGLVYLFLIAGVPGRLLARCFPFAGSRHLDYGGTADFLKRELQSVFEHSPGRYQLMVLLRCPVLLLFGCLLLLGLLLLPPLRVSTTGRRERIDILLLGAAMFASSHEFFLSGNFYSLSYLPGIAFCILPPLAAKLWLGALGRRRFGDKRAHLPTSITAAAALLLMTGVLDRYAVFVLKQRRYAYLPLPKARVWHEHRRDDADWSATVRDVTRFIIRNTTEDEPILVVPFDPVYLFLSGRPQVCRTVDFSGYQGITQAEERNIIRQMEAEHVRLVVFTNTTVIIGEKATEMLGVTHYLTLWDYISKNYQPSVGFGSWDRVGSSCFCHGARIYVRCTPFRKGGG